MRGRTTGQGGGPAVVDQSLSHVRVFVTLWAASQQAPLSVGSPRQGYQGGLPFPSPRDPKLAGFFTTESPGKSGKPSTIASSAHVDTRRKMQRTIMFFKPWLCAEHGPGSLTDLMNVTSCSGHTTVKRQSVFSGYTLRLIILFHFCAPWRGGP